MIRQSTLTSKQHDLSRCILSRELKLRELYIATGIYQGITRNHEKNSQDAAKRWNDGESSFLDANNIIEGRFFNLSLLPSFHGTISSQELSKASPKVAPIGNIAVSSGTGRDPADLGYHGATDSEETALSLPGVAVKSLAEKSLPLSDENTGKKAGTNQPVDQDDGTADTCLSTAKATNPAGPSTPATEVPPHHSVSSAVETEEKSSEPSLIGAENLSNSATGTDLHDALPSTADGHGDTMGSTVSALNFYHKSQNPGTTQLLPDETQETRLEALPHEPSDVKSKESPSEENRDVEIQTGASPLVSDAGQHQLRSPVTGEGAIQNVFIDKSPAAEPIEISQCLVQPLVVGSYRKSMEDSTHPKLKLGTNRLDSTLISTPATPDEQLRLEEAQSMQKAEFSFASRDVSGNDQSQSSQISQAIVSPGLVDKSIDGDETHSSVHASTAPNNSDHRSTLSQAFIRHEHDQQVIQPLAALRERAFSGMAGDSPRDPTLSRRPPMRIDTGVSSISEPLKSLPTKKNVASSGGLPQTPLTSSTPTKSFSAQQANSPPERMTTRVSSGARRHKSVSEILGETPKATLFGGDKEFFDRSHNAIVRADPTIHTPRYPLSAISPDSAAFKMRLNDLKGKEKSKLSSVVFARTPPSSGLRRLDSSQRQASDLDDLDLKPKEYLQPLFAMQSSAAAYSRHLHSLISSAPKTLNTSNHYTNFHDQQDSRILERIFQLQSSNLWSLRQPVRSDEPERPVSHRDVLLSHTKWMATDFKEERKWKIVAAKSIADSCADWVNGSVEERILLEVKVHSASMKSDSRQQLNHIPDLIPSTEDDSSVGTDVVTPHYEVPYGNAPSAIFSVAPEMFCFGDHKSAVTQKLLRELPLYQSSVQLKDAGLSTSTEGPDSSWRRPIISVSKFAEGKIVSHEEGPPRKRSRYEYGDNKIHRHGITEVLSQSDAHNVPLRPERDIVALLNPDNKHIRDRIHAGHAFRPPSEHVMPSQNFFECRQPSQWTQGEDDELRKLVREYAYNWSLISCCLSSSSIFSSGAERRTPWECFERWISLEGLPAEMSKTQYFRAYHSRLQAAQKTHEAQQQALQQHQGNNTPHLPMRRRTTQPHLVDQRKNDKHLRMLEAMRKLAKKRETALHKQQHVAGLAAMRKANEAVQPRAAMHTPQEFSRVKYERECKMQESAKAFKAQMLQQQKAAHAQKAAQQSGQVNGGHPAIPPGRPPGPIGSGPILTINSSLSNGHPQPGQVNQSRPIPQPPRPVNGVQPNGLHVAPANPHAIPHAPMQPHPLQQRMQPQIGSDSMRIYQEATRVQAEQQRFLLHQRQQVPHSTLSNGQATNSASPNLGGLKPMVQNNPAMLTSLHGRSSSPSAVVGVSAPPGSSSSPRMTTASQAQSLSSGLVPAVNEISNQIKALHPNASPEQLKKMTTDALIKFRNNHAAQAAMHAAAGTTASIIGNNMNLGNLTASPLPPQPPMINGVNRSPPLYNPQQQYSHILRNQQSSQQSRNTAPGMGGARPGSRCGTPQMHRSGSIQGGSAPTQSPRPGPAQIAGSQ